MELNDEILNEIKRVAAAGYNPRQTAFILGLNANDFAQELQQENSAAALAYYQGFYASELAVREGVFQLARNGSSPAQTLALKILDETRKTILKDATTGAQEV